MSEIMRRLLLGSVGVLLLGACSDRPGITELAKEPEAEGADSATLLSAGPLMAALTPADFPVNVTVSTSTPAFRIVQTGSGHNGNFEITNSSNANEALRAATNGGGVAVFGLATGTGSAGYFVVGSTSNPALDVRTNGQGAALRVQHSGSAGDLAYFEGFGDVGRARLQRDGGFVVYGQLGAGQFPTADPGVSMTWYPRKAAFMAGGSADGTGATALGSGAFASGRGATALGSSAFANADQATALGPAKAWNPGATAMGLSEARELYALAGGQSTAHGNSAVALGNATTKASFGAALGRGVIAAGSSVALGSFVESRQGTFIYGDASTQTVRKADLQGDFIVFAAGGIRFRSSPDLSTGCDIPANTGIWICTSSRAAKEDFRPVDAEEVLTKLAGLEVQSWSYRGEGAGVRHVGPFAEDFHRAFGLGSSAEAIGTGDIDGIDLVAIQALERRTRDLPRLRETTGALQKLDNQKTRRIEGIEARLARLEALLESEGRPQ